MSDRDEQLVTLAQKGDTGAFEELVRRTSRLVYARIYMETGDAHRTEDLVQETFLTAYRSLRQLTDPQGFRSWLFTIAQSVTVDDFRRTTRKKRTARMVRIESLDTVKSGTAGPSEAMEQAESREAALSVLRSLPEEYRMPLMLRYLADADYETISRQLGLTNGSLRGLLNRGMALLRNELQKTLGT